MSLILDGTNGLSDIDGSAATPAIRGTDANTGIFFPAADTIAFSEGGTEVARFNADSQFVAAAGTAALPVFTTTGDVNTGIFFPAADTIAFSEGGVESVRIDSSSNLSMTGGGTINTPNTFGFKNRIINGAMVIDQRNAGSAVTMTNPGTFDTDRWYCTNASDGVMTAQQVSDAPAGFINSLKCTTTTADATLGTSQRALVAQYIEGLNTADLAWGTASAATITISFWVKSSLTGTFGGSLRNNAADRSYPFTYAINAASTWEQKSVIITGDTTGTWLTTNGTGIGVHFGLGVATNLSGTAGAWAAANNLSATGAVSVLGTLSATWQVTGVQLEKGTQATSFDYRPYGTELALCYRYFQKFLGTSAYEALPSYVIASSTTALEGFLSYKQTMRVAPSLAVSTICVLDGVSVFSLSGASVVNGGVDSMRIAYSGATGLTQFRSYYVTANNSTSAFLTLSSEL
jgi:hypothetical protein